MTTAQELIDISVREDRTATDYPATREDWDALYEDLLAESHEDCEPEQTSGAGFSGPDARGSVILWGVTEDCDIWRAELVNPPQS